MNFGVWEESGGVWRDLRESFGVWRESGNLTESGEGLEESWGIWGNIMNSGEVWGVADGAVDSRPAHQRRPPLV